MRTAGNISIQCKAAATDADPDAHTCTQTSASGSATYSASLKVGADSSFTFQATQGAATGLLICAADYPGAGDAAPPPGQLACFTINGGDGAAFGSGEMTLGPKPSLVYTNPSDNEVTIKWS